MNLTVMTTENIYTHIGRRVREERILCGWTQEQLAEKADVHLSFIGQLERGIKKPSLATIKKLSDAFGIKAGALLDESPPSERHGIDRKIRDLINGYSDEQQEFLYRAFKNLARQFKKFPGK